MPANHVRFKHSTLLGYNILGFCVVDIVKNVFRLATSLHAKVEHF